MMNNFALIIGAMKCGTTSLFAYLSQHPQVSACSLKEPKFFSNQDRLAKGFEWYQSLWNWQPPLHKIALEASVDYTRIPKRLNAAEAINEFRDRANFRFIYVMRNPLERIESHYTHGLTQGWSEATMPLSEGIDRHLIEVSQYAKQVEEYYKRFPSDSILLINFDHFKADPLNFVKRVCRFLDVDPNYDFQGLSTVHNANNQRLADERWLRSIMKIKPLRSLARVIPKKQKRMIYRCFGRQLEGNFKLSPEQRDFVINELQEDLLKLNSDYGVDISPWGIRV